MGNMSLEELRNQAILDTTKGKIAKPLTSQPKPTLAESDPAFTPSNESARGVKRTPTIQGEPPKAATPSIKVVNASFDSANAVPFDVTTLEKRPQEPNKMESELMADLDKAVEAEKKSITERINALTEKQYEEFIEGKTNMNNPNTAEIKEEVVEEYENPVSKIIIPEEVEENDIVESFAAEEVAKTIVIAEDEIEDDIGNYASGDDKDIEGFAIIDNNDLEQDLKTETGEDKPDLDAIFKNFRSEIKKVTNPIKNKIDLSKFSISKDKYSPAKIHMTISDITTADHFLPNAEKVITCSALSGPEMLRMNPENSTRNKINTLKEIYNIIYKHIESKKPATFEAWLKSVRLSDLDHIYFALYKATFSGSNFTHYECPNESCSNVFIKDIAFEDLIKYADDDTKNKMENIFRSGDDSFDDIEVTLYQISDDFVVGLRNPSIWNAIIEIATLSDGFLSKYEELIDVISYIDSVYKIDTQTQSLIPIDMMPEKDNLAKSTARRIKILADVLRTLSSDNYYELRGKIVSTYPNINTVTYRIPETTCPKCGAHINEMTMTGQQLLFMRHQLGAFGA